MSDKQTGKTESAGENEAVVAPAGDQSVAAPSGQAAPEAMEAPAKRGSSAVAWLALLLVLALAAAAGWFYRELQRREDVLLQRLGSVETLARSREGGLDQRFAEQGRRSQQQVQQGLDAVRGEIVGQQQSVAALSGDLTALQNALAELRAVSDKQAVELARYSANDRQTWLLAELEYLLRMANQRLIMSADTKAAEALLASADNILKELDDVALYPVRAAVAADRAAVRAVPAVDVQGIYLRLEALAKQADGLRIFQLPEQEATPQAIAQDNWQARLQQGYRAALDKLSHYIIIRRRDVPLQTLMDPQWEGLVRQNLRMLLEQAQVALLSGNTTVYRTSLERSQHWVAEFFESDAAASRAMASEIRQLQDLTIAVDMPDISGSLRALDAAKRQQVQQGGGE